MRRISELVNQGANVRSLSLDPATDQDLTLARTGVPNGQRQVPARWHVYKRTIDCVLGGCFAAVTLPIVLVTAVAIFLITGGNPIFSQERVGLRGKRFPLYKLRTMVKDAHAMRGDLLHLNEVSGPVFKMRNDPRLHPMGSFLRRTSIDELPNFWNVLRGEMSLVGPRPPLPSEVEHYNDYARRRLSVKPGVTCLWQISGRSDLPFDDWMRLDNRYIDTWSPGSDLKIILWTLPAVLRRDGAR